MDEFVDNLLGVAIKHPGVISKEKLILNFGETRGRGEQAKVFVKGKLKDIESLVTKTYKTDMYGRFVADVFYHPPSRKGKKSLKNDFSSTPNFWKNNLLM